MQVQDAVASLIGTYDVAGRYLDRNAIDRLKDYFAEGQTRVKAAEVINANAASIVKRSGARLFEDVPELLRPGGNAYTTRRFSACLRDMDYFLRYASYALVAGNNQVLDDRVLYGLRETYTSLGVPTGPVVRGIAIMSEMVCAMVQEAGVANTQLVSAPFDHLIRELSENDIG
jgi:phycobilisome core component